MKRKALCIVSLFVYLLLFCTIFAPMAQREMTILVDVKNVKFNSKRNTVITGFAAAWGDKIELYQIVEGKGWNPGSRVDVVTKQYYHAVKDFYGRLNSVELHPGEYTLILSASQMVKPGDLVQIVESAEIPGEQLIIYCPEGIASIEGLQNNFTIASQGEKGILMDTMSIRMPFFEHRTRQSLVKPITAEGMRVYSYTDAQNFLQQLPRIAWMAGLLFFGVILWAGTCLLTRKRRSWWLLLVNIGFATLTLVMILQLTNKIDLPASLMPTDSMLNIHHYVGEFSNVFTAMDSVGDYRLQELCRQMLTKSVLIVVGAVLVSFVIVLLEKKLFRIKDTYEETLPQ